jgi:hypothetical protein
MKQIVTLPRDLIDHCERYGRQVVDDYRAGLNSASLAVSSHGAEANVELQSIARMAECAFCCFASIDPLASLNWSHRCDPGYDVWCWNMHWDIKYTNWHGRFLIWPINKRAIFHSKKFDALCLVKADPPRFLIGGHTLKAIFAAEHLVAPPGHKLAAGTWYMHESDLW